MAAREDPVLVIGATGQQGGATARALLRRGRPVRALVRDPDSSKAMALQAAGAQLVCGDLDDVGLLQAAMDGVEGVFLVLTMMVGAMISPAAVVAEQRRGRLVADLAKDAGVEHLVYSSLSGVGADSGIPYYASKEAIEAHIRTIGLPATVLRPVSFMDNFATYNRPALENGEIVVSLAVRPDIPMALVAVRDVGEFAAIAFTHRDRFRGQTIEIAGDVLTPPQIADTFARVCGYPARYRKVPIEHVRAFDEQLSMMFEFFNNHPATPPDIASLRAEHPGLLGLAAWLRDTGWKTSAGEASRP
ncbi:MAG: NmrA/HSCARG family protein [Dermatophilaceae bacterium]